ncbi:MAG TPA: type VI secretion system tube protein Hcp [Phycisphaerae bacterium]|nr:type VI secretion system tube protein Hcp [Phycisphaerae bacterium]
MRMASLVAATVALAAATTARANIYMQYTGVNGTVGVPGYSGDVELDSFSVSVDRNVSAPTGGSSDRESSAPAISDILVTGGTTSASADLLYESLAGEGTSAKIFFTKPGGGKDQPAVTYAEWDLTNAIIDKYSTAQNLDGASEDTLSINFTKFVYTWYNVDDFGNGSGSETVTYDLATTHASRTTTGDVSGFQFVTAVPEPATAGLLLLAGPLLLRRRRR